MKYVIGMDLGGTNIVAAVCTPEGRILFRKRTETMADSGFENVVGRMAALVTGLLQESGLSSDQVEGLGIGVPGYLDMESGVVHFSPNFAGWTEVSLVSELQRHLAMPIYIVNDVNSHALGEYRFGAGRGAEYVVVLALGTGVGGGAVLDGRLYTGSTGGGGEMGHMIVDPDGPRCGCGNFGCLEAFANAAAVVDRAVAKLQRGRPSLLPDMVGGDIRALTAADVCRAAEKGDMLAVEVWDEVGMYVGIAVAGLIQILSPEVVVIGGGVSRAGRFLMEPIARTVEARSLLVPAQSCRLELSTLGDDAGVLGAASLVVGKVREEAHA